MIVGHCLSRSEFVKGPQIRSRVTSVKKEKGIEIEHRAIAHYHFTFQFDFYESRTNKFASEMVVIFTAEEMMEKGLLLRPNFDYERLDRLCHATKFKEFSDTFSASPQVAASIWEDLLTCNDEHIRLSSRKVDMK